MKLTLAIALLMGVNTISLNRPHERNYFAAGVSDGEVDVMAKSYAQEHRFAQIGVRFNGTESEHSDQANDLVHASDV